MTPSAFDEHRKIKKKKKKRKSNRNNSNKKIVKEKQSIIYSVDEFFMSGNYEEFS